MNAVSGLRMAEERRREEVGGGCLAQRRSEDKFGSWLEGSLLGLCVTVAEASFHILPFVWLQYYLLRCEQP